MSNNYSEATGVLMFDGPAKITPVIRMLFKPFKLDEEPEDTDAEHYVAVLSEDNYYYWDSYIEEVVEAAAQAFGIDFQGLEAPPDILKAIGAYFRTDLNVEPIDFDRVVELGDIVQLAISLADDHNLIGFRLEGSWYCDRPRLWEFGGWTSYRSQRYALDLSTSAALGFAESMDDALSGGLDQADAMLANWIRRFISGITDETMRDELGRRFGLLRNAAESPSSD